MERLVNFKWISRFKYTFPDVQVFYTVKVDGVTIKSVENTDARSFKDVKVFAGDNFYEPADGSYSKLIWESFA